MVGILWNHFDKIILWYFLGFEELAIYSLAMLLPDQAKAAIKPLTQMFLPKLTKQYNLTKHDIYRHMRKLFILSIVMIVIYLLVSPLLFERFYPGYLESTLRYSQIFMLSFVTFPSVFFLSFLQVKEKTKLINLRNIISPLFFIIFPVIWIYFAGLWGVIVGRMVARVLAFILNWFLMKSS